MNTESIENLILSFSFGIAIAIFLTPIFVYLKKIMYHQTQNQKWLDKAIKDGNVVNATKIKEHDLYRDTDSGRVTDNRSMATYEYMYRGKTYKTKLISYNNFNNEIQLYFINNPKKAVVARTLWTTAKNHWIRSYFLMVLLCSIVSWFILVLK